PFRHDEVRRFADELGCIGPDVIRIACAPDNVDPDIAVLRPTQLPQALAKRSDAGARIGGALAPHEQADFPHPLGLLRARRERPGSRRAAESGQQFPPSDGDCHTPLPCEVRKGNDTTLRWCSLHVQGAGCWLLPPLSSASVMT